MRCPGGGIVSKQEILLVEPQEELLKLESLLLTSRGYKVNAVTDGRAAIDYIAENRPDLVMLDVNLPGVNGFEVCQYIKCNEFTRDVPVILLSAENHRLDFAKGEQVGADCYITKPFRTAMFIEMVKRAIAKEL
jgi:CheY-like chemotaxis protein